MGLFDHKQPDYHQLKDMEILNELFQAIYEQINFSCPNVVERQYAIQHLEECSCWAKKAIMRNG